jgi:hypothetical protein
MERKVDRDHFAEGLRLARVPDPVHEADGLRSARPMM